MPVTFASVDTAAVAFAGVQPIGNQRYVASDLYGELHRSADDGATWAIIGTLPLLTGMGLGDLMIVSLLWAPGAVDLLFAAAYANAVGVSGLFKSTDGGDTWAQVWTGEQYEGERIDTMLSLSSTHFLMSGDLYDLVGKDILESVDAGDTWTPMAQTGAPAAIVTPWKTMLRLSNGAILLGAENEGGLTAFIYKSADDAANWTQVPLAGSASSNLVQEFADLGSGIVLAACAGGVWRSDDFGDSWVQVLSSSATVTAVVLSQGSSVLSAGGDASGTTWLSDAITAVLISTFEFKPTASGWQISEDNGLTFSTVGVLPVADSDGSESAAKMVAIAVAVVDALLSRPRRAFWNILGTWAPKPQAMVSRLALPPPEPAPVPSNKHFRITHLQVLYSLGGFSGGNKA